ncbi:MAG: hypothetical protein QNJ46_25895 [Leptolyngbyaceae cyanobacterium MO_188.B28]|nr:hypothetical protein [Leptolyngbyaceae cyanobacterium MO_188.B28]
MLGIKTLVPEALENLIEFSNVKEDIENQKITHSIRHYLNQDKQGIKQIIFHPECVTALKIDAEKEVKLFVHNPDYDLPETREEAIALLTLAAIKQSLIEPLTEGLKKTAIDLAKWAYDMTEGEHRKFIKLVKSKENFDFDIYINQSVRSTDNRINILRIYLLDILAQQGLRISLQDQYGNSKSGNYNPTVWLERVLGENYGLIEIREHANYRLQAGFSFGIHEGTNIRKELKRYKLDQFTEESQKQLESIRKKTNIAPNIRFTEGGLVVRQGNIFTLDTVFATKLSMGHFGHFSDTLSILVDKYKALHCFKLRNGKLKIKIGAPLVWHSPKLGIAYAWCKLHGLYASQDSTLLRMQHMFDNEDAFMDLATTRLNLEGHKYTLEMMNPTVRTGAEYVHFMALKIHDNIVHSGLGINGCPQQCGFDLDDEGKVIVKPQRLLDMQEGWMYIYKIFEQYPEFKLEPLNKGRLGLKHIEDLKKYLERYAFYGVTFLSKPEWQSD